MTEYLTTEQQELKQKLEHKAENIILTDKLPAIDYYLQLDPAFATHIKRAHVISDRGEFKERGQWTVELLKMDNSSGRFSTRLLKRPEWLPSIDDIKALDETGGIYRLCLQYFNPFKRLKPRKDTTTKSIGGFETIMSNDIEIIGAAAPAAVQTVNLKKDMQTISSAHEITQMIYGMAASTIKAQNETMTMQDQIMQRGIMQGMEIGRLQAENQQLRDTINQIQNQLVTMQAAPAAAPAVSVAPDMLSSLIQQFAPVILEKLTGAKIPTENGFE